MKKIFSIFMVLVFVGSIVSVAFARTLEEEKTAVRDYLKVVDGKINKYRNAGNTVKVKQLQGEKKATLKRWAKLQMQMEAALPTPVAPVPSPAPVVVKPTASAGLFGWGIHTTLAGQYINTGKGSLSGSLGVIGNVILDDFIGLGTMVGMSANTVKYKIGAGYLQGGGGLKAIPVYAGGIIYLPSWFGGQETYLTGGLNYVVDGNGQTSGKLGGDVALGINADLGLGLGKTGFELGYSVVRSKTVTSKGLSLSVSQSIVL